MYAVYIKTSQFRWKTSDKWRTCMPVMRNIQSLFCKTHQDFVRWLRMSPQLAKVVTQKEHCLPTADDLPRSQEPPLKKNPKQAFKSSFSMSRAVHTFEMCILHMGIYVRVISNICSKKAFLIRFLYFIVLD